jgi:hypothetical protein
VSVDAVLLSRPDHEALEETAHLLRVPANAKRLLESLQQACPDSVTSTTSHGEAGLHPTRLGGLHLLALGRPSHSEADRPADRRRAARPLHRDRKARAATPHAGRRMGRGGSAKNTDSSASSMATTWSSCKPAPLHVSWRNRTLEALGGTSGDVPQRSFRDHTSTDQVRHRQDHVEPSVVHGHAGLLLPPSGRTRWSPDAMRAVAASRLLAVAARTIRTQPRNTGVDYTEIETLLPQPGDAPASSRCRWASCPATGS